MVSENIINYDRNQQRFVKCCVIFFERLFAQISVSEIFLKQLKYNVTNLFCCYIVYSVYPLPIPLPELYQA